MSEQRDENLKRCPKCGSMHFFEVDYRQYMGETYSSTPGGELRAISSALKVCVCLCGEPVLASSIRSLLPEERESLVTSFERAAQHREQREPEHLIARLQESFVSRPEFQTAVDAVEKLGHVAESLANEKDAGAPSGESGVI